MHLAIILKYEIRRHGQVVRHGSAKPSSPVRIRVAPPKRKMLTQRRGRFCFWTHRADSDGRKPRMWRPGGASKKKNAHATAWAFLFLDTSCGFGRPKATHAPPDSEERDARRNPPFDFRPSFVLRYIAERDVGGHAYFTALNKIDEIDGTNERLSKRCKNYGAILKNTVKCAIINSKRS